MSGFSVVDLGDRPLHQIRHEVRDRRSGDPTDERSSASHAMSLGHPRPRATLASQWCRKRLFSRHIAAQSRRGSPTRQSSSTRRSSTGTASRGSTSRRRSCSSATRRGEVTEAFSPDFYLPEQDLYLEVTVMKQSLVTRKNRKLRKLRALYPTSSSSSSTSATSRRLAPATGCGKRPERAGRARRARSARSSSTPTRSARASARSAPRSRATTRASEPLLVGSLKSCIPFVCDLSRATQIHHHLDFVELAGYGEGDDGIRFLKDLNAEIEGATSSLVDAVIDTGLTMHYLVRSLTLRSPSSLQHRHALRPPVPAARRRPAGALRGLHDPGRVLRRLRLRARRALPQPARSAPRPLKSLGPAKLAG